MSTRSNTPSAVSRRQFLAAGAAAAVVTRGLAGAADAAPPRQATGVKVGEVTDSSAIVWTRLTAATARNGDGRKVAGNIRNVPQPAAVEDPAALAGACPGAAGRIRVRFGPRPDLTDA